MGLGSGPGGRLARSVYPGSTTPRLLFSASLFQFVTYACFFSLTPVYPEVGRDLNLDAGVLGTLVGTGGIVSIAMQVPAGTGGDRWGRRRFFAIALVFLILSQAARSVATTPGILLVAQVLGGAAQGIATVNAWAVVADAPSVQGRGQGQAFGILNANLALGLVAGYLLAGGLDPLIGWRAMSLALGATPLLALPALAWIPGVRAPSTAARPGLKVVLRSVTDPRRLALTAMAALTLAAGQGAVYLLPFATQQRALGPFDAALLLVPYVVGSVIVSPLGGRISDHLGTSPVIVTLLVIGVLAAVALVWGAASSAAVAVCFMLIGASVNGALPLLAVRMVALGDPGVGVGTLIAGLRMGQSSGTFLGPAVAGLSLAHAGLNAGWLAQAACLVCSLALFRLARRPSSGDWCTMPRS